MRCVTLSWRALIRTRTISSTSSSSSSSSSYRHSSRIVITPVSAVTPTTTTTTTTNRSVSTSSYNPYDSKLQIPPHRQVAIVGAKSMVREGVKQGEEEEEEERANVSTTAMIGDVLKSALDQAGLTVLDLDGLVAVPSLSGNHFMEAHYQATALGLFEQMQDQPLQCHTLDTGGAGPVSALLHGEQMISSGNSSSGMDVVAVIAADAVGSMTGKQFLNKADDVFFKLRDELKLPKDYVICPAIPHGYDRITEHQLLSSSSSSSSLTRDQLRMTVCLESFHAGLHPESLQSQKSASTANSKQSSSSSSSASYATLSEVRASPLVTNNISQMECARRADGAACLILASNQVLQERNLWKAGIPVVIGGGQASGPLYPPQNITDYTYMSCKQAMDQAYASAGDLSVNDIQYFGLYDCFPICLIRAIEACGLAEDGGGGEYVQKQYERLLIAIENGTVEALLTDPTFFPINTHGGLLCYGAPWEVPAMFSIVEAVDQLQGQSQGRAIDNCQRALVYGNGGVLSASAVAILETSCL
jgi:acetyl-CoA acetyltransferase